MQITRFLILCVGLFSLAQAAHKHSHPASPSQACEILCQKDLEMPACVMGGQSVQQVG